MKNFLIKTFYLITITMFKTLFLLYAIYTKLTLVEDPEGLQEVYFSPGLRKKQEILRDRR